MKQPEDRLVRQVGIEFLPREDRLLLRVASGEGEMLAWLTRRCVRLLWPMLLEAMAGTPAVALQPDGLARDAMLVYEHERVVAEGNFSTPYCGDSSQGTSVSSSLEFDADC